MGALAGRGDPPPPLPPLWPQALTAEIYLGRQDPFLTVVSHLESREPLWAGKDRNQKKLNWFFAEALPPRQRRSDQAV